MDIRKDIIWSLIISEDEPQVLYYVERPEYKFQTANVRVKGKTFLESKGPTWSKIALEASINMLPSTAEWIKSKSPLNVYITASDSEGGLLEKWQLTNAKVIHCSIQKSKTLDTKVAHFIVDYERAKVN